MATYSPTASDIDDARAFVAAAEAGRATADEVKRAAIALAKAYPNGKADDEFLRMLAIDMWSLSPTTAELSKLVTTYRRTHKWLTCHDAFTALKAIAGLRINAEAVARRHITRKATA